MKVIESSKYKKSKKMCGKGLRKLDRIIHLLIQCNNFEELKNSNFSKLYGFEQLKHSLNRYFSFRVDNKMIRLIVKPNKITEYSELYKETEVLLADISSNHYEDFKKSKIARGSD